MLIVPTILRAPLSRLVVNTQVDREMTTAVAASEGKELRLAGHFPLVDKSCKKPAAKFFSCFSEKADQPPDGDASAARNGLAACANLMADYDECMSKVPPRKMIRVQEEYRLKPGAKR